MSDDTLRWTKLASRNGPELPLFDVRLDTFQHPESATEFERIVLRVPEWVNVVATPDNGRFVMVEQYRFGIDDLTVEPVGGLVDPGEDSLEAAKRELLEETGYGGGEWRSLGSVQANPAFHNNRCHHWLAEGVEQVAEPSPDSGEAIAVHVMTLDEVREALTSGRFAHSLGISAMSRAVPLWEHPYTPPPSGD